MRLIPDLSLGFILREGFDEGGDRANLDVRGLQTPVATSQFGFQLTPGYVVPNA